ncbi:hypothetical protein BDV28DRAFT_126639 [Aspergillus coremiiformis]|uniref:Uncharacterized protein n=1 Tax=Aspergillus coremiiformis TaxID=138285 RepID=A0A5N6ZIM6_9EURO|nr:hypothetical protein BDV28DRAFT_126639 [Aspergillus coremiiformis]
MAPSMGSSHRRSSRPSRPIRSSRTQVQSYHENSSSEDQLDDDPESDDEQSRPLSLSLRPRDSHRMPVSYREASTDGSLEGAPSDEDPDPVMPVEGPTRVTYRFSEPSNHPHNSNRPSRKRTVETRSQTRRSKRVSNNKRLELGRSLNKRRKIEEEVPPVVGSGVIPPWQTLPYHILLDIFYSAAYPLVDEKTATRNSSVQWLVNVSLLCRAFHEPALAALYHCPPLIPPAKAHGLLNLLTKPQESLSTNYINKIRELHIDAEILLAYKSGPALGYFELPKLVEKAPQLKILRLYHSDDFVVGLPLWQRTKWIYPESLFTSLVSSSIRLRSWDWNSRFMETNGLLPYMMEKHLQPAFCGLRELRVLHISSEDSDGNGSAEVSNEREVVLATALKELPELRRLEFLECSIVNEHLLPNLPSTLTSLTINNCDEVTAANFSAFLASHGQHLRELALSHNRHLSLSFIVGLAQSCQSLERFKMDISIHDLSSYHDVEPHFRELLNSSEVPTWPATLRDIELIQLRKWDDTTADVFFTSLIDAAPVLRNLRRLVISAILKIGWRDRASFRERWIGRLEKVFLRRSAVPNSILSTIPPVSWQPIPDTVAAGTVVDDTTTQPDAPGSGLSTPSKRKSARIAQRKLSGVEDDVGLSTSHNTQPDSDDDQKPLTVQGMCDVVMVRIDNQRPSETQFNEEDFLDDEVSGDEDWNGYDMDAGDTTHAW